MPKENIKRPAARFAEQDLAGFGELLRHIAHQGGASRADLARLTKRSRSTVTPQVEALLQQGLVVEAGLAKSGGGRRGQLIKLNTRRGLIMSADLGATQARLAVSDITGAELGKDRIDLKVNQPPEKVLDEVSAKLDELLAKAGRRTQDVHVIVVGVPAPVEFSTGTTVKPPLLGLWDGYSVRRYFQDRYSVHTIVDNDVNLMALGEHRTQYPGHDHLLFVKVGTGIGCGIIIGGELYRGADGAAGDIGHVQVAGADVLCRCGNLGCLEAVAGGQALAQQLGGQPSGIRTARDVAERIAGGDPTARNAIRQAARRIGEVLATIVSFANPSAIVIGGSLAHCDQAMLAGIRSGIYNRTLPLATSSLAIKVSELGQRAGTEGGITLAQQYLLSEGGIGELLGARPVGGAARPSRSGR